MHAGLQREVQPELEGEVNADLSPGPGRATFLAGVASAVSPLSRAATELGQWLVVTGCYRL